MKRILMLGLAMLVLTALMGSALAYNEGEYTAEALGHAGNIQVTVTIDADGRITDVKCVGDQETPTVGGYAMADLPAVIIKAQTTDIDMDAFSGATNTTKGVLEAVQACLDQAGGEPVLEEAVEEAPAEEAPAEEAAEEAPAEEAAEEVPAEEAAEPEAVEPGAYTPGEYTAEALGHAGNVQVTVTIDEDGRIAAVSCVGDQETPTVGGYAMMDLPAVIIKAQGTDIDLDAFSGATNTTRGVLEAVEACLAQAAK